MCTTGWDGNSALACECHFHLCVCVRKLPRGHSRRWGAKLACACATTPPTLQPAAGKHNVPASQASLMETFTARAIAPKSLPTRYRPAKSWRWRSGIEENPHAHIQTRKNAHPLLGLSVLNWFDRNAHTRAGSKWVCVKRMLWDLGFQAVLAGACNVHMAGRALCRDSHLKSTPTPELHPHTSNALWHATFCRLGCQQQAVQKAARVGALLRLLLQRRRRGSRAVSHSAC